MLATFSWLLGYPTFSLCGNGDGNLACVCFAIEHVGVADHREALAVQAPAAEGGRCRKQ